MSHTLTHQHMLLLAAIAEKPVSQAELAARIWGSTGLRAERFPHE